MIKLKKVHTSPVIFKGCFGKDGANAGANKEKFPLRTFCALLLAFSMLLALGGCTQRGTGADEAELIYGQWITEEKVMYTLLEDGTFYWHRNTDNLQSDYYRGSAEICNGQEALEQLQITEEQWQSEYKALADSKERVFCVLLSPDYMVYNGETLKNPLGQPPENLVQLRIIIEGQGDAASYYNYRTEVSGRLTREEQWVALPEDSTAQVTLEVPKKPAVEEQPPQEPQMQIDDDGVVSLAGIVAYNAQWYDSAGKGWKDCYVLVLEQGTAEELARAVGAPPANNLREVQLFVPDTSLEEYVGKKVTVTGTAQAAATTEHRRPMVFQASKIELQ